MVRLQDQIGYWKRECEKIQQSSKDAMHDLTEIKRSFGEKEKSYKEQLHGASAREQGLRGILECFNTNLLEEMKSMKQEIIRYENYAEHLKEQHMALELEMKKLAHNQTKIEKAERINDELRRDLADQKKEFEIRYSKLLSVKYLWHITYCSGFQAIRN